MSRSIARWRSLHPEVGLKPLAGTGVGWKRVIKPAPLRQPPNTLSPVVGPQRKARVGPLERRQLAATEALQVELPQAELPQAELLQAELP